jgi:hypothetical protein
VSKLNAPLAPGQAKPTVGSIYADIGFGGLWGGLGTRIFMIGTLTARAYGDLKLWCGLQLTDSTLLAMNSPVAALRQLQGLRRTAHHRIGRAREEVNSAFLLLAPVPPDVPFISCALDWSVLWPVTVVGHEYS